MTKISQVSQNKKCQTKKRKREDKMKAMTKRNKKLKWMKQNWKKLK